MASKAAAASAAVKHATSSAVGFGAALAAWLGFHAAFGGPEGAASASAAASAEAGGPGSSDTGSRSSLGDSANDTLQLVQVVFRHGARTPLGQRYWRELGPVWDVCGTSQHSVPIEVVREDGGGPRPPNPDDDKQVNETFEGGCHKGQLTLIGQQQALDLGRWLRWRYAMVHRLLPVDGFEATTVMARTTNYQRTIATLQGVLSGLFPGVKQPIMVHTAEEIDEILYTNVKSCKKLRTLLTVLQQELKLTHSPRHDAATADALQERVRAALGLPPDHTVHWVDLHDALTTMLTHGRGRVPEAMRDPAVLRGVNELATARFMHVMAPHPDTGRSEEVLRLGLGVLLEMMVRRMEAAGGSAGPSGAAAAAAAEDSKEAAAGAASGGPRIYLYSGHDSSILPLLAALGKHVTDWPPYISSVVLELWRRPDGEQYVKVLYNRAQLPLTELCGGATCDLQLFKDKVLGSYLLTRDQHKKECLLHFMHDQPAGEHVETEEVAAASSSGSAFQDDGSPSNSSGGGGSGGPLAQGKPQKA